MLEVINGSFSYNKSSPVLKDVSFSVNRGELMAILGPNGAGKTTLLRCIMGMLKWSSGKSLLDGEDIRALPASKLWQKLAYVPQARSASGAFTAFETVLLGRSSHLNVFAAPKKEDVQKAESALERLGIAYLADKKCSELSGGELQMVLIARALAAEPEILVLDEPESNLDFKNQLIVLDTMSALTREGMSCVFNTHYPAHALSRADKSLILSKGGKNVFGETNEVLTRDSIRSCFGVEAAIGEIETPENILRDIVPVSLAGDSAAAEDENARCIASVTIISEENTTSEKINALLHDYSSLLIGRMGMPYRDCGLYIINVTLDGKRKDINALSHKLGLIPGISAKTTFAKGSF